MFFNWIGKKKAQREHWSVQILQLDAHGFIQAVKDLLSESEPAAATMCVVALQNLGPILSVAKNMARDHPGKGIPTDLDSTIRFLNQGIPPTDEREKRRQDWFLWALLVQRASALANRNAAFHEDAAMIWIRLAEGGKYLRVLLEENIIWDNSEKEWFTPIVSERDGASYVLNHMSPKWLRSNDKINAFAESHDFFVFDF